MVWQLAIFGNGGREPTRRERKSVQFPILDGPRNPEPAPENFEAHARGPLRFLVPRHRAIIEGHQPYKGWHGRWIHPFLQLRELSNEDKHRAVSPVLCSNRDIFIHPDPFGDTILNVQFMEAGIPLERDTVVAWATTDPPEVQYNVEVAGEAVPFVTIPDSLSSWITLFPVLDEIAAFVANVIRDFEPLP